MSEAVQATLQKAHNIFKNIAENADVKTILSEYSYDDARIAAGQALFAKATEATNNKGTEYGNQLQATEAFHNAFDDARKTYMKLVKIARVALENSPADNNKLGLNGQRGKTFSKISDQITLFYTNALSDAGIAAKLAAFALTEAKLSAGQTAFTAARDAYAKQHREIGEAVISTQTRDAAIHDLSRWIAGFLKVARVAFEDQPQMVEVLGV